MKSSYRILIVDDEQDLRANLEVALKQEGFDVVAAENGNEALEIARAERPDIMLLDVMMPGMDGHEVCKSMKENSETENTRIIFLTAKDVISSKVKGLDKGADDYITKPFSYDELLARVRAMCRVLDYRAKLESMVEFANALNIIQMEPLLEILRTRVTDIFNVELFSICMYDAKSRKLSPLVNNHPVSEGIHTEGIPLGDTPFMKTVIEETRIVYVSDFGSSDYSTPPERGKYGDEYALGIPLIIGGEVIGVLNLNGNGKGFFEKPDFAFMRLGAEHIASSISNAIQHKKIQEMAVYNLDMALGHDNEGTSVYLVPEMR